VPWLEETTKHSTAAIVLAALCVTACGRPQSSAVTTSTPSPDPPGFATPDNYPTGGRGITFTFGFFSAKHLGRGQFYLLTMKDQAGA